MSKVTRSNEPGPQPYRWDDWQWQLANCLTGQEGLRHFHALTSQRLSLPRLTPQLLSLQGPNPRGPDSREPRPQEPSSQLLGTHGPPPLGLSRPGLRSQARIPHGLGAHECAPEDLSPERPSPQGLLPRELETLFRVVRSYPWAVTPYYLSLSRVQDPHDPIRRQFLPEAEELDVRGNGSLDPLDEKSHEPVPGLIRRYPDRAVLLVTGRCAVFCRHCFRKRLWRQRRAGREVAGLEAASLSPALDFLRATTEVREVILSGGDPLILPDESLDRILDRIRRVPHVEIVRIGTRLPVVLPQRITPGLCQVLERHATVWVVTQFNHPREITPESAAACERLLRAGVPVVNQTVLLRGVNDDLEIMTSLCQGLLRIRVKPYYLHQCDRVAGAEHFRTPLERGVEIIRGIQGRVSGLALPKFVVDLPGKAGKVPLHPGQLVRGEDGRFILRGNNGETFFYENPRPEACPAL